MKIMGSKLKKVLSAVVAASVALSITVPAMAMGTTSTVSNSNFSSITYPISLNGGMNVKASASLAGTASTVLQDDGSPQRVETKLAGASGVSPASVTLITADRYFLYTPDGTTTPKLQFYAIFDEMFNNSKTASYRYKARLATTNEDTPANYIDLNCDTNIEGYLIKSDDLSKLISDPSKPATLYISVWDGSKKLYGPGKITVKYVQDSASIEKYNKYFSKDDLSFYINLDLPGINNDLDRGKNPDISMSILDEKGQTVAKDVKDYYSYLTYDINKYSSDDRYSSLFGYLSSYDVKRIYSRINMFLYRVTEIKAGIYDLKVSINGKVKTYPNLIQIVDGPVVRIFTSGTDDGIYEPPVVGGNTVYVVLDGDKLNKDDFDINIVDEKNNVVGKSEASRYLSNDIIYRVKLSNGAVFQDDKMYNLKLNYKKSGKIYFTTPAKTESYAYSSFQIYNYSFNQDNSLADFTFKTVNASKTTGLVTLGLFDSSSYSTPIATVQVAPKDVMSVQFKDVNNNILKIAKGKFYDIKVYEDEYKYWSFAGSVYVSKLSDSNIEKNQIIGNPYFYTTDKAYNFDVSFVKSQYGITDSTQYQVILKNEKGDVVGKMEGNLTTSDSTVSYTENMIKKNTPAKRISGSLTLSGKITEGVYKMDVTITNGTEKPTVISFDISGLVSTKQYATFKNTTDILYGSKMKVVGTASMLKGNKAYDAKKFTYQMFDLNGKAVSTGPATTSKTNASQSYKEDYSLQLPIINNITAAIYNLKIKYDGKDVYDLNNPTKLLSKYLWLYDAAEFDGVNIYDDGVIKNISIEGKQAANSTITAILYDASNAQNFTPVKTVTLAKDPSNPGKYIFTKASMAGVNLNKAYDIIIMSNGMKISNIDNCFIKV